jgi:thioredoxin 1
MSEHVMEVTDATFEKEVLQSSLPVLVDFWASWCQPCRMIAPVVEELAKVYGDRLRVAKMNVDENENTPSQYGIRGIPALLFFKGGKRVDEMVGAVPRAQLVKWMDEVLGS